MTELQYMLLVLGEEGAEITQAASKASRFGVYNSGPGTNKSNKEILQAEYNDMLAVAEMLAVYSVDLYRDEELVQKKKDKVKKFLAYSKGIGTVQ